MLSWVTRFIASPALLRSPIRPSFPNGFVRQLANETKARNESGVTEKQNQSGESNVVDDRDKFKVNLNVKHFKPEEVSVKIADNFIVVEGKHEEEGEHRYLAHHFVKLYKLPKNVDENAITSTLSSDGILQLVAPKKETEVTSGRAIKIIQTNKPFSNSGK